jgi:copper chaperone CopZ
MRKYSFLMIAAACLCLVSCRKHDIRKVVVETPGIKSPECARVVQEAFMKQPGIRSVEPDFERGTLAVTYDSMVIAIKNIEFVIAEAGFDANDEKARPEGVAKLPPECRED